MSFNIADILGAAGAATGGLGVALRMFTQSAWYRRQVALRKEKIALIESKERSEQAAEEARKYALASSKAADQWRSAADAMDQRISALEEADVTKTRTISALRAELEDMWSRFRAALHFIINQLDYTRVLRKLIFEHLPEHPVPEPPAMPTAIQADVDQAQQGK